MTTQNSCPRCEEPVDGLFNRTHCDSCDWPKPSPFRLGFLCPVLGAECEELERLRKALQTCKHYLTATPRYFVRNDFYPGQDEVVAEIDEALGVSDASI